MLDKIITWSLDHRFVVVIVWIGIAIFGAYSLVVLPVDAFPDTTPVQVQINTVAAALSPEEVEQQITFPVEQAISGLKGLDQVRSLSKFGLSQVTAIFADGIDIYLARQQIMERLSTVELPVGLGRPEMGPVATGLGEVFHYIVSSDTKSLSELRTIQDWIIRLQLLSIEGGGVAEVNSWGGLERQFQVVVDPNKLIKYNLTLGKVTEALRRNNSNVGGGVITRGGESLLVQGVGLATTLDDVSDIVVKAKDGVPVYVKDLGQVIDGHATRRGTVTFNGQGEAVLGLGFMLMGENTREITQRLVDRMEKIKTTLPEGVEVTTVYDRRELVDRVLDTVRVNLFEGALLMVAVLLAFLGNLRAGLIVALAIPLSMLVAGSLMLRVGIAGSLMSLGAIDFGLIVDSSVIMVENSVRRLGEGRDGASRLEIVRDAALEVRRPTMFGELIIMIVYLPILTLEGIEGRLFAPMALTVVFALAGSMVLSLTLMPVLASLVLHKGTEEGEPWLVRQCKRVYGKLLSLVLSIQKTVMVAIGLTLVFGVWLALQLGAVFIPRLSEEAIVINTVRLAGVSAEESARYGTQIEKVLLQKFPKEIKHIWSRTGTAEVATDPMGLEVTDVFLTLYPRQDWSHARSQEELVGMIEAELSGLPAMRTIFAQPIELRVNEMIAGIRSDLGVKIFGDDFETLQGLAETVEGILRGIEGCADPVIEQLTGQPVLRVEVIRDQLARHGVSVEQVLDFVAAVGNVQVGEIRDDQTRFPLTVRLPDEFRQDPEKLGRLLIPTALGQRLPLGSLAQIRLDEGPSTIQREWSKRRLVVQANVRGRDVGSFVADAQRRIEEELELPSGYYIRYGGQFEHLERGSKRLMLVVPVALALVFVLLYVTYGRLADVLRISITLPLSAVGGLLALHLRDMPFSISAGVGFVAMSGVSVLGDMVYVSYFRQLLADGKELVEAVWEASLTRMRPVLMTGLVASFGFVPMAFNTSVGAEVQRPLATVVVGSVISSTLLTLFVLPVLYSILGSSKAK